jgi:hypothetical protein
MNFQITSESVSTTTIINESLHRVINDTVDSIQEVKTLIGNRTSGDHNGQVGTILIDPKPDASQIFKNKVIINDESVSQVATDTLSEITVSDKINHTINPFNLFYNENNKFSFKPELIWPRKDTTHNLRSLLFSEKSSYSSNLDWTLFIGTLSLFLLILLKVYYQKYITRVMNTMLNFQLADNLFREKNSLAKRAFFLLNLNFIFVFSLFILMIFRLLSLGYFDHSLKDYLLIICLVSFIVLVRFLIFYSTAYVFKWMPAVHAHLHVNYLINKNLGLLLLPIVFIAIYTTPLYSKIMLIIGIILVIIFTVFRLIRGFQIILRNGILLFYAILYLCTLELLPIVLGSRLITLLR